MTPPDDDLPPDDVPGDDVPGEGPHEGEPSPGRRAGGRPPKLTPDLVRAAVLLLVRGNFRQTVAQALGVTPRTFRRWLQLGQKFPDGVYGELARAVPVAEAAGEVRAVGQIMAAGRDDWRAAAWWLERKYPQRWGKYRGELGELKRQVRELEKLVADVFGPKPAADPAADA